MPIRVRNSRPKKIPSSHLLLLINETLYRVHPVACESSTAERAFRLDKGDGTLYDVAQTRFGVECDCPDFVFRRDGLDPAGCKHVKALVAKGLLRNEQGSGRSPR
jgi:hypothetical protein